MPHITIECSANVAEHHDIEALVEAVHAAALEHGLPAIDALRTRVACRDHYRVADCDPENAFVAIHAHVGRGRDVVAKTTFIEAILDAAESTLDAEGGPLAIAWSVELTEIDPELRINRNHVRTRMAEHRRGMRS